MCFFGMGVAQGQTVFWSNLNEETSISTGPIFESLRNIKSAAQSFTTGDTATTLVSITLMIDSISVNGSSVSVTDWDLELLLYTDSSSLPGTLLETLSSSTGPTVGSNTYTSDASTLLEANTTYWWVASPYSYNVASSYDLDMTTSTSGISPDGWATGDAYLSTRYDSRRGWSSWTSYGDDSFKFSIVATSQVPEPATSAILAGLVLLGIAASTRRRDQ
jgi:hypothetical protein